jgi:hypothetical protein
MALSEVTPGRRRRVLGGILAALIAAAPGLSRAEEDGAPAGGAPAPAARAAGEAGEAAPPARVTPRAAPGPLDAPRPFTSAPLGILLSILALSGALGAARGLLPASWRRPPFEWLRAVFAHTVRIGWLAFVPAVLLDGLVFFMGGRYSHGWTILVFTVVAAIFAAGLQWEKTWWNPRRRREEPYVPAFNYYGGLALAALIPALIADWILSRIAAAGRLTDLTFAFNTIALAGVAATLGFVGARLVKIIVRSILLPHTVIRFFLSPASRFYAIILTLSLAGMAAFNYLTLPAFFEVIGFTLEPFPAINLDQALIILLPNLVNILCVTYFSIFAGSFISMLPIILFSKSLRKKPVVPPALDVLLRDPAASREYLGRELREEDVWPTIVTVTAYNEPPDPLEKTLYGYLKIAREWAARGLPRDRYIILFSHQTEREEERIDFERFLAEKFPDADPRRLLPRDWRRFDEDNPTASVGDDSRLLEILRAWVEHRGLSPDSKEGRAEMQKRHVCQRLYEFSLHAPRELFGLEPPPARSYGPREVESWIWYYLIPKKVGNRLLQVTSKAHNLYYAREGVWGKKESSPLARDGIFHDAPEWLFDASDADSEIHESCVAGILASYTPFYREPRLGWLQRLSYTIDPSATFLSAVKSASETAYWSWYLRARVHTYTRRGKAILKMVGDVLRPLRRDFQAANGHNLVVRGTSIRASGGDIEHETATVHAIESPLKRWIARLRGTPVPAERAEIERWVPTGEDLELATRMALEGYYGDYAVYAPQGEGSPADFRGNVPQAIRWSGNNVQLIFMHLGKVFSSPRLTFNEKMGYFTNLATLASAPLLYLAVIRAVVMPFLDIPDVYAVVHPGLGPLAFVLALAPNFLLLSLALAGQLVVKPAEPWQRSVLNPGHRRFLQWIGYLIVPPASILLAACIPGWFRAIQIPLPEWVAWGLVIAAVNVNIVLLLVRREVYASLAYCIVLLPFLQVLYLAWVIFGVIGCINMLVKTQVVEPYISRLAGTFHPPVAGRYPSDAGGRFLPMTLRFPWLFAPFRWVRENARGVAVLLGAAAGLALWLHPPQGWPREAAAAAAFIVPCLWSWRRLSGLMSDWFLDRDSLANRWWDYWTNPQPAFVKTLKERQERSLSTILKDNVFGILNGILIIALILHVHFVNAADFSAALLAYLTFSIAASWIISPFFYEEPYRTLRSQGKAFAVAAVLIAAFLAIPLGLVDRLERFLGIALVPPVLVPWIQGLLGALALGGIVNLAPWGAVRSFAKRFALAAVMLGLLFLNALAISYRGVSIEPILENWALRADGAFAREVREEEARRGALADLEESHAAAEREETLAAVKERLAFERLLADRAEKLPKAAAAIAYARRNRELALEAERAQLEIEGSRTRLERAALGAGELLREPGSREAVLDTLASWARAERDRRREALDRALAALEDLRRSGGAPGQDRRDDPGQDGRDGPADLAERFETDVVAPLRDQVARAEDMVARVEAARDGDEGDVDALHDALAAVPAAGELQQARRQRELADREWETAAAYERSLRREVAAAAAAHESARKERESAALRSEVLAAKVAEASRSSARITSLRLEAKDRARKAFWTKPARYRQVMKDLGRFRPLLEDEVSRERLAQALRWVAGKNWVKRVTLEGAAWYPKTTLLALVESDLPDGIARARDARAAAGDARRIAELLIALESLDGAIRLLDAAPVEPPPRGYPTIPPRVSSALVEARRSLRAAVDEDPTAAPGEKDVLARAASAAGAALAWIEPHGDGPGTAEEAPPGIRLARAGLETCANALAEVSRTAPAGLAIFEEWLREAPGGNGALGEAHRRTLVEYFSRSDEGGDGDEIEELEAWRRAADAAAKPGGMAPLLTLLATASSPGPLVPGHTAPQGGLVELDAAIRSAIDLAERARDEEEALGKLEDEILAEIDRLEPYLLGEAAPAAEDLPHPLLLLEKERTRKEDAVAAALDALSRLLDAEAAGRRQEVTRRTRPERDRLRAGLLRALEAGRAWALEGISGVSMESAIRTALAWRLGSAAQGLSRLFDPAGAAGEPERGGLIESLERARAEAAGAAIARDRANGDAALERRARSKDAEARAARARVEAAWSQVRSDIDEAGKLEGLLWKAVRRRADDAGAPWALEEIAGATTRGMEESLGRSEVLGERVRRIDGRIAALEKDGVGEDSVRGILASAPRGNLLEGDVQALGERVAWLREEIARVESEPPGGAGGPPAPAGPGTDAPRPEDRPPAPPWRIHEAIAESVAASARPGGDVFSASKETEIAREELGRSAERFCPELFGSLGAASNAPSIFLGGGFTLVTLSLDMLENREVFERKEEEKQYLRELAELLAALKAARAHGAVIASELEAASIRSAIARVEAEIRPAGGAGVAGRGGDVRLSLERERLGTARVLAESRLAAARRAANALAGRPPGQDFTAGFEEDLDAAEALSRIDAWLGEAREAIRARFPSHPAFRRTLAAVARFDAQAEEARLKIGWPVLRAGAGAAAPNDVVYSVGASLIFPILDRKADLEGRTTGLERRIDGTTEDERLAAERTRREVAGHRHRAAREHITRREEVLGAHIAAVREAVSELLHGFSADASQVAGEVAAVRLLAEESGAVESYISSGLDLVEAAAALPPGDDAAAGGDRAAAGGGGAAPLESPGDAPAASTQAPAVARERERLALEEAKLEDEERLFRRLGVGAGFSYSSLLIPLPSVEIAYGRSARRREMARAAIEYRRGQVELARLGLDRAALDRALDARRDALVAGILEERARLAAERLALAERLEREGDEPPLTVLAARRRLARARRDLEAARAQATQSRALEEGALAAAGGAPPDGAPAPLTLEAIDREVSPDAPAFRAHRRAALRAGLAAEAEYRYRALIAAIESKKPYGGNIGNLVSPIWDLIRLWRRPGTPEEIEAAISRLRASLLRIESSPEGDAAAAKELEDALANAKSMLGGDGYDAETVGLAIHDWRRAELALEDHDALAPYEESLALREYRSSIAALASAAERARKLGEDLRSLPVAGALGRAQPLRRIDLEDDLLRTEEERARALWRYARARAGVVFHGGPLDAAPDDPAPPARLTLDELARAYAARDPRVLRAKAMLSARRRELELTRRLSRVALTIPEVLPSLAVDPRFGGSGLAASTSAGANIERDRHAGVIEREVAAVAADRKAAEVQAAMEAFLDAIELDRRTRRVAALEEALAARRDELRRRELQGEARDVAGAAVVEARARVEEAESALAAGREEARQAETMMAVRAGAPVTVDLSSLAADGAAADGAVAAIEDADPAVEAARERASGAGESAALRRKDAWLGSRVHAVGSLGQEPETVETGAGGFLAIPLHRLIGVGSGTARIDEIRSQVFAGEASRLEREDAESAAVLRAEIGEWRLILERRARELEIARRASDIAEESRRADLPDAGPSAAPELLEATTAYLEARARWESARVRLLRSPAARAGEAPWIPPPPPAPVPPAPAPVPVPSTSEQDDGDLAIEIVEALTVLPRGSASEIADLDAQVEVLAMETALVKEMPAADLAREIEPVLLLDAALAALGRTAGGDQDLRDDLAALRREIDEEERRLRRILEARTAAEWLALQAPAGGSSPAEKRGIGERIEERRERILAIEGIDAALREALERSIASRRESLEARRKLLLPGAGEEAATPSLRPEDLRMEEIIRGAGLPEGEAARASEHAVLLARLVPEVRDAKRLDALGRWEVRHASRKRRLVQSIDAHGLHRRAAGEAAAVLRILGEGAPEARRRLVLAFRSRQLELAGARLGAAGEGQRAPEDAEWAAVEAAVAGRLSPEETARLDRIRKLRGELARALLAGAEGERGARGAGEVIGGSLSEERGREAARRAAGLRDELEREAAGLLASPGMREALPQVLERVKHARIAGLRSRREAIALDAARFKGEKPRPLPVDVGLKALARARTPSPNGGLDRAVQAVARGAKAFRAELVSWRAAREEEIESPPARSTDERAERARDALEKVRKVAVRGEDLESSWSHLVREVTAIDGGGSGSLLGRWRSGLARSAADSRYHEDLAGWHFSRLVPAAVEALSAGSDAERRKLGKLLLEHLPPKRAGKADGAGLLEELERARELEALAWETEESFLRPRGNGTARASLHGDALEKLVRDASIGGAAARGRLGALLDDFVVERPTGFLRFALAADLQPPSPGKRLAALEAAQARLSSAQERAREVELALGEATAEARAAAGWRRAEEEVARLREEVYRDLEEKDGELPREDREALERGYADGRGKLSNLPDLVDRDRKRIENAVGSLAEMGTVRVLRQPVAMREVQEFLDLQLTTTIEEDAGGAAGPAARPQRLGHSRSFGERDESFTRVQALHAIAYLLLEEGGWETENRGIEKAGDLLRPYAAYAGRASRGAGGFRGLPRAFLASTGEVSDPTTDRAADALVAIASQLHLARSGIPDFLPLAESIAGGVLLPAMERGGDPDVEDAGARAETIRSMALSAAAFRNQAEIHRALGARPAGRFEEAERRAVRWLLEEGWSEADGAFGGPRGAIDLDANLLALAVVARRPELEAGRPERDGLQAAQVWKAGRKVAREFTVKDDLTEELEDLRSFRLNWFLKGPIDANNRFLVTLASELDLPPRPELTDMDAWLFLNRGLHRITGGLLGFTTRVSGLAPDTRRRRLDPARTAQAVWVLRLLGRRIEETTREGTAEEMEGHARAFSRELEESSVADDRNPIARSWPLHAGAEDLETMGEVRSFAGEGSTEAACQWVFAQLIRRGSHPFFPRDVRGGWEKLALLGGGVLDEETAPREPAAEVESLAARIERLRAEISRKPAAAPDPAGPALHPAIARPIPWLERRIASESGLILAIDDPHDLRACRPYPSALAIIHFALAGSRSGDARHIERALALWHAMQRIRRADGAWADRYDLRTGAVDPSPASWATGPASWMVLAGLHLHIASGERRVLDQARETLDWVLSHQDLGEGEPTYGAVNLGDVQHDQGISTEANADALAAAWGYATIAAEGPDAETGHYRDAARRIADFLARRMWLADGKCFATGWIIKEGQARLEDERLDSQTWTLLALHATRDSHAYDPLALSGLDFIEGRVTSVPWNGRVLRGFGKVTIAVDAFWPEGVAGYVLAARRAGKPERFFAELDAARFPDGTLPHIIGALPSSDWKLDFQHRAVDGTIWAAWAHPEVDFNPFQVDPGPAAAAPPAPAPTPNDPAKEQRRALEQLERRKQLLERLEEIERMLRGLGKEL